MRSGLFELDLARALRWRGQSAIGLLQGLAVAFLSEGRWFIFWFCRVAFIFSVTNQMSIEEK